jgi:hypothetical protein
MNQTFKKLMTASLVSVSLLSFLEGPSALAASAQSYFKSVRNNPPLLRNFLSGFPKGGELHTHLDGAIYAESYIAWAAADGKCIDLPSFTITIPPCDESLGRPLVADIQFNPDVVNPIIDAFSVRNYEHGSLSGHDQFFATFQRYSVASKGRQGSMLAEITARAARQNTQYLELMDSAGMRRARKLAVESQLFDGGTALAVLAAMEEVHDIVEEIVDFTDEAEQRWREELDCANNPEAPGCDVEVRYLAQIIRTFPKAQVLAQTIFAFKLIERDPRYIGINFVAPEDAPITLRDYRSQMKMIREVAVLFPESSSKISLHAGELAMHLVPPEELRDHIHQAVHIAGASRIGHGVDIIYEDDAMNLIGFMAEQEILVEINLTSNAVILGIEGDQHPFDLYRSRGVPLALSTDDEGVARVDLTHEYVRATQSYNLSYDYLKELSRNALAYSFLPGDSLFNDVPTAKRVKACARDRVERGLSASCQAFMAGSEKARLQWQLEKRFKVFEAQYN